MPSQTISVDLPHQGQDNSYDIVIGSGVLEQAGTLILPLLARPRVAIVTDETVAGLHLATLTSALDAAGIDHCVKVLPAGEATKSFAVLETVSDWLLAEKIERDDMVIAFGGGVIGDLTGFAAAILRRGVAFIQIPTTLLAQVDSSVGGKTAINVGLGKNLIGAFHQPKLVLADITLLDSLPRRDFLAGYAEVVKYAALGDADFFDWLDAGQDKLMARDTDFLQQAVAKSCAAKAAIVAADEKEKGERALLNLGHTFGHAYEALTSYGPDLLHGEAVALGMVMAFEISEKLGHCSADQSQKLRAHLEAVGLPVSSKHLPGAPFAVQALMDAMAQDKKVQAGIMTFILVKKIGQAFISKEVSPAQLESFLSEFDR